MRLFVLLLLTAAIFTAPVSAVYALETAPVAEYANHQDDEDEDEDEDEYRNYRYSSSLQRKIRKLDDDPVEEMPVPVLFVKLSSITSDFGDPRGGGTRTHEGQDILAPQGSFIISPTDAVVTSTGKGSSSGTYVYAVGPGGESFRYMHLDKIAYGVKSGKELKKGDIIGYVGNTGNASGGPHHLHFEIRDGRKATDPYPRLGEELTREELLSSLLSVVAALKKDYD